MAGRFGRFLRLEGPRKPGEPGENTDARPPAKEGRFDRIGRADAATVAKPAGESSPTESGAADGASVAKISSNEISARFSGEEPPIVLEATSTVDLSFRRCWQCSSDSGRYAVVCQNCGVSLDTPGQRAFEEVFAKKWAEQRAAEQEAAARDAASRAEAGAAAKHAAMPQFERPPRPAERGSPPVASGSLEEQRRRLGEMLAEQVRRQEELKWDDGAGNYRWMVEVDRAGQPIRNWIGAIEPFWLRIVLRLLFGLSPLAILGFGFWVLLRYLTNRPVWPLFVGAALCIGFVTVGVFMARRR